MGRIVGIDYGKTRIGLAVSDESRIIATALETVQATKDPRETAKKIADALSSYKKIDTIVIGLPLHMNGKESEMSQSVRAFATVLEEVIPVPIIFWDERLTSAGVEKMLKGIDMSRKKRASVSDALSAVSILQNYLDSLRK